MSASQCDLSIIVPVYCNEGSLAPLMEDITVRVLHVWSGLVAEVIFVDDGSEDNSFEELLQLRQKFPNLVRIIRLTRNFGQASALKAGFDYARGANVVMMSADGQDPADLIGEMLRIRQMEDVDVVIASRQEREESVYRIVTSRIFYKLMQCLCFPNMPHGGFDFALLSRRALKTMLRCWDAQPFIQGQILWMGFKSKFIPYRRRQRRYGTSKWTFARKLTYMLDGIMNYSYVPIRFVSLTGLIVALAGFLYAGVVLVAKVFVGNPVKGWTPLMIAVLVLGGLQMITLGILGEYMWRIFAQVKPREPYVIDQIFDLRDSANPVADVNTAP